MFKAQKPSGQIRLQKMYLFEVDIYPNRGVQKLKKTKHKSNENDTQFDVVFNTVF